MCDYGPGISAEPISGGTGRLGRALTLGPRSLLSVPRPLPSQKFKGMGLWFSSSTCTTIRFGM